MSFDSIAYLLFLPVVYAAFYLAPDRYRWVVLLAASYLFYAALLAPQLLAALLIATWISYRCGILIAESGDESRRRTVFWSGTGALLLVLAVVKYLPPLVIGGASSLLVSIGISYFTFQAISNLADVYLELNYPERHAGYHALSLAFFPKLLQGPLERSADLLPQLRVPYTFQPERFRSGLVLFGWGLFQKVVLADRLALFANQVFNDVHAYTGFPLLLGTYAYAFQIFFDFSGYTDMARGAARLFGIELTRNFASPYLATSVSDFWRRWHISFSRWILDYIFKPLQMAWRDLGKLGTALALVVTFLISGIWHGATWGYLVWGALHGVYLAGETYYRPYQKKLHRFLRLDKSPLLKGWQVLVTFHLVCLAWVFFRAASLGDAWYLVTHLFVPVPRGADFVPRCLFLGQSSREAVLAAVLLALLAGTSWFKRRQGVPDLLAHLESRGRGLRWAVYYLGILALMVGAVYGNAGFIYYRF